MCRILAYIGEPLAAQTLLFDTGNSLVRQSYSLRMMNKFLNLAGFGMKAWDPTSVRRKDPFTYCSTSLPSFDRNLRFISAGIHPDRHMPAHVVSDVVVESADLGKPHAVAVERDDFTETIRVTSNAQFHRSA